MRAVVVGTYCDYRPFRQMILLEQACHELEAELLVAVKELPEPLEQAFLFAFIQGRQEIPELNLSSATLSLVSFILSTPIASYYSHDSIIRQNAAYWNNVLTQASLDATILFITQYENVSYQERRRDWPYEARQPACIICMYGANSCRNIPGR